jgi:hypothetical protein
MLEPLATAEGTLRAEIVDAQLLFDAQVTVPIRRGEIDFGDATVEHVGPDSRMGVSRTGVYVDAPNGRSYLYRFPSALVAGVTFEERGALLGPWVTDRGKLHLQAFVEGLLQQGALDHGIAFSEQARALFDRTSVSGDVQLGDGKVALAGIEAELGGRADQRNVVRIHSEAVGRGLTVEITSLSARNVVVAGRLKCDEVTGSVALRLSVDGTQLRATLNLDGMRVAGLQRIR